MKGLDKIIGRIRADAMAEIDAIRAEGDAKAAEVTAAYEAKAGELLAAEVEKSRLASLAAASGTGDEEIILSAADAAEIGAQVVEKANAAKSGAAFTLSAETRELEGGLVLKRGSVEVNCAFATQLRLLRQTMAADVAAILFS